MTIASTLSGMISVKHPTLGVMCRSDGAILMKKSRYTSSYTFGSAQSGGYKKVKIKGKFYFVHRLIAEAFLPSVRGKPFVDHINRVRNDNRVENLRWVTAKENIDNSSKVLSRNKRIPVRFCNDKKAYNRFRNILRLSTISPYGRSSSTCALPQDIYDQLKPLSQRDRFIAYRAYVQSQSE